MGRFLVVFAVFAIVLGAVAVPLPRAPATRAGATPAPPPAYELVGVTAETLADQPPRPLAPPVATTRLIRYTYQPGGRLAYPFPGPVTFYVDSGVLGLEAAGPAVTVTVVEDLGATPGAEQALTSLGPGMGAAGGRFTLHAGDYVYAADGDLGPTRNAGDQPLVVLALVVLPASLGELESIEETAVPATPAPPGR